MTDQSRTGQADDLPRNGSMNGSCFQLGAWNVEPRLNRISRSDEVRQLEPKTMEVLVYLAHRRGQVIGRDELFDSVWGETFVTDNTLSRTVSRLRRALDDDWQNPRYLETISKSGYRLIAPVARLAVHALADEAPRAPDTVHRNRARGSFYRPPLAVGITLLAILLTVTASVWLRTPDSDPRPGLDPSPELTLVGRQISSKLSPEGGRIAFSWKSDDRPDHDIYIKTIGVENPVRLTGSEGDETYLAWSSDGLAIAYVRLDGDRAGIYRMASIGGAAEKLIDCSPKARHLTWSPSGDLIAFSDVNEDGTRRRLLRLDLATGTTEILTDPKGSAGGDSRPVYSPDGRTIAFTRATSLRRDDVILLDPVSGDERRLTEDDVGDVRGQDWTPDGSGIVYSSNRTGQFALWLQPVGGGAPRRLPINDQWVTEPSLARESRRLIYRKFSDVVDIHSFHLSEDYQKEGESRRLAPSTRTEFLPALSEDGSGLAFISNRSGELEIWSSDLRTRRLTKHTALRGLVPGGPAWSRDGSVLVFDSPAQGNLDLYSVQRDSRQMMRLTSEQSDEINARFSRDGRDIYFASNRSGDWQIWKMPSQGGAARQLTTRGGFVAEEGFEGRFLYFSKADATLWKMPLEGGDEEKIGGLHPYDWGAWRLVPGGAIFVTRNPPALRHVRFRDQKISLIHQTKKQMPYLGRPFDFSPRSRMLVFAEIRESDDEVMMVDWR